MLTGKGMWLWEIERTEADPTRLVALAQSAGLQHVIVKVADGEYNFPVPAKDPDGSKENLVREVIAAFRKAGIAVWGWGFVYGSGVDIEWQAHRLAARARKLDLEGLAINAEDFGQRLWSSPGGAARAQYFMETLRDDLAGWKKDIPLALSSYRYMSAHEGFPFETFMKYCDVAMPQVYWVARGTGDALANLQKSYDEYHAAFPDKPYIPTGAAYGEIYGIGSSQFYWSATPEQIAIFLKQAEVMGFPAVNFWSWQHARNDPDNRWFSGTELWDAIAAYPYKVDASSGASHPTGEESDDDVIAIQVGDDGYHDGVYAGMPNSSFGEFARDGRRIKYARTSGARSSVWAAWLPVIPLSGQYEIAVWVPGVHATTQRARYAIHGVAGQTSAMRVELNQQQFDDVWVSLGTFQLDANHPQSGMVNLNNLTGEFDLDIAFAGIRWQPVKPPGSSDRVGRRDEDGTHLADGFDPPIGVSEERRGSKVWPGFWFDATGFGTRYRDSGGGSAYHTGADLNLNKPHWNTDAGLPVYAAASGVVTFVGIQRIWGGIVIIRHDPLVSGGSFVYSRSAHLATIGVRDGQRVNRGDPIGTIGKPTGGTEHLHFDISPTEALLENPGDWPRLDWTRLRRDYTDPRIYIQQHRPR